MDFNGNCKKSTTSSTNLTTSSNNLHTLSIEIKATDEIIILPNVETFAYELLQYKKLVDTIRDVIFFYNGVQKGKIYNHRQQTIIFHKFQSANGITTWIT